MVDLDLVVENERLQREVRDLRTMVETFESSRWWRLRSRLLPRRSPPPAAAEDLVDVDGFHSRIRAGSAQSAAAVAVVVNDLVRPETVVDVGGGEGWWAGAFAELGATAVSVDGATLPATVPGVRHVDHDLERPLGEALGRFDLALCLELLEHIGEAAGDRLVGELCELAPVVLFSAAVPGQGGVEHLNEQWPAYWVERFAQHGYRCSGALRWQFWEDERIEPWYRQNLFVATSEPERYPTLFASPLAEPWAVVHPAMALRMGEPSEASASG